MELDKNLVAEAEQGAKASDEMFNATKAAPPTTEEELSLAIRSLIIQQKGLTGSIRLHIRNFLNMLTAPNIDGKLKKQIKESIERAIIAGVDYGVDIYGEPAGIRTHGRLGKLESHLAMQIAKAKETGMVLIADKLEKQQILENNKQGETNEENKIEVEQKIVNEEVNN